MVRTTQRKSRGAGMSEDTESQVSEEPREDEDDAYALNPKAVAAILYAVDISDRDQLVELMEPLHAADIADLLEQINAFDRMRLIKLYGQEFDGEILTELDESIREEVINLLNPEVLADRPLLMTSLALHLDRSAPAPLGVQLADAVRELDSDDVVDLLEDLEEDRQTAILEVLEDSDRVAVQQSLTYPEYSAGRLMQREVVMAPEHWNVGEAIDYLRNTEDLPEQFYHIVLVDPRLRPVGNVPLGTLMSSRREVMLKSIVSDTFHVIPVTRYEGEVAYAFNQYHLISAPVVDENERLVGVITIDDAMAVLDEEHEEDILRLAGVGEESSLSDSVLETTKQRFPWLAVNLVTAVLASLVIAQFEEASPWRCGRWPPRTSPGRTSGG